MRISVIIITKDEQPRLRLTLLALGRQTIDWHGDAEIVLVDDGSAEAVGAADIPANGPQPRLVRHACSRGRSIARNEGAAVAHGERLLFLDGDVLLSPTAVERHARLGEMQLGRGEQRHLRGTRFFADPRTGIPWPGKEARVRSIGNLAPYLVTEEMVAEGTFEKILARSDPAIYPGAAARKLYDLEMGTLRAGSAPHAEWLAAAGHNFSISRRLFAASGGFAPDISINEHRELALRLCREKARLNVVEDAVSLHLTHREGYRNPLISDDGWKQAFERRHPFETDIMMRLWRSLAEDVTLPHADRVLTLEHADELLRRRVSPDPVGVDV